MSKVRCVRAVAISDADRRFQLYSIIFSEDAEQRDRTRTWMGGQPVFCQIIEDHGVLYEVPFELWDFDTRQFKPLGEC